MATVRPNNTAERLALARWLGPPFRRESIAVLFDRQPRAAAAAWRLNRMWHDALAACDAAELGRVIEGEALLLDVAYRRRHARRSAA